MTDLRIDDAVTAGAAAALRAAANRLPPVVRAVQALDAGALGTNALADELTVADQSLATALRQLGEALTGLATWIDGAATGFGDTDRMLACEAPG
jgi:hypothetical protein